MGKGMKPKQGYNQKLYDSNYDEINWSKSKKKNEIPTTKRPKEL